MGEVHNLVSAMASRSTGLQLGRCCHLAVKQLYITGALAAGAAVCSMSRSQVQSTMAVLPLQTMA